MSLADEDWIVDTARCCQKTEPVVSKAWLLTARTLFPKSFAIQLEAYRMETSERNTQNVAQLLEEMLINFPQESELWDEVQSLAEALQSESSDPKKQFLTDVFCALPSSIQCHSLLRVADNTADMLQQCRLMLLILDRYPDRVHEQGVKMIDTLLSSEKHSQSPSPVNRFRKYLVCDVLPVVFKCALPQVPHKHMYRWLQKAVEFYVNYITNPPVQENQTVHSPDAAPAANGRKLSVSFTGGTKKVIIPGLSEKDSYISNPWEKLFELIQLVAKNIGWKIGDIFQKTNPEARWQHLNTLFTQVTQKEGGSTKQVLFCAAAIYLHSVVYYCSKTDPDSMAGGAAVASTSSEQPLVLIEGFRTALDMHREHKTKKMKIAAATPKIQASKNIADGTDIIQYFITGVKCWELLHTAPLENDYGKLQQHWKVDNWAWLKNFETDILIYQGNFSEAANKLLNVPTKSQSASWQIQNKLQTASCYYCLGNYPKACEMVLHVMDALPQSPEVNPVPFSVHSGMVRHLQLLCCTEAELLPYCIHLIITCFKEKAFGTTVPDDLSLGHMIVLVQYDWPRYEALFAEIVERIRLQRSFTYNQFFNYVVNIDILEEFAYIKSQEGGKVTLDILPTSVQIITQSRTVTRGVNKGVKEDFKVTMEKQVARSNENIETIIRQFLTEEKNILFMEQGVVL